jgi:hypothetical protein
MSIVDEVTSIIKRLNDTGYYDFQIINSNDETVLILEINFKYWYYNVSYKNVSYKDDALYVEFSKLNQIETSITRSQIADWENIIESILNRERLSN